MEFIAVEHRQNCTASKKKWQGLRGPLRWNIGNIGIIWIAGKVKINQQQEEQKGKGTGRKKIFLSGTLAYMTS